MASPLSLPHVYTLDRAAMYEVTTYAYSWLKEHKDEFFAEQADRLKNGLLQVDHERVFSGWTGDYVGDYHHLALEKAIQMLINTHCGQEVLVRYCTRVLIDMAGKDRDIHMYTVYVVK